MKVLQFKPRPINPYGYGDLPPKAPVVAVIGPETLPDFEIGRYIPAYFSKIIFAAGESGIPKMMLELVTTYKMKHEIRDIDRKDKQGDQRVIDHADIAIIFTEGFDPPLQTDDLVHLRPSPCV